MFRAILLLLNVFFTAFTAQALLVQNPAWIAEAISQKRGSCETSDLSFSAVRFSKIDLHKKFDGKEVFLRVILFLRDDGGMTVRLNEQALLGCVVNPAGEELCSYKSMTDQWFTTKWNATDDSLRISNVGVISKTDAVPYRNYVMKFFDSFSYGDFHGQGFSGAVVLVNFDSSGRNVAQICHKLGE